MTEYITINKDKTEVKETVFTKTLGNELIFKNPKFKPINWKHVILICKDYNDYGFDLLFAYDKNIDDGALYLGHAGDEFK